MSQTASRLAELGLTLPAPAAPVANYVGYTVSGKTVYIIARNIVILRGNNPFAPQVKLHTQLASENETPQATA